MLRLQHLLLLISIIVLCIYLLSFVLNQYGAESRSKLPLRNHNAAGQSSGSSMMSLEGLREISATINERFGSMHSDNEEVLAHLDAMKARLDELSRHVLAPRSEVSRSEVSTPPESTRKGLLLCEGAPLDSEVVYWKVVPGDLEYESPITPHHHEHDEKFITFNYDPAGFNNVRMTVESMIVAAHAMGRTLVFPPNLDCEEFLRGSHNERVDMGFEDLMSMKQLRTQRGFHSMTTEEFLRTQGLAGKLMGVIPRDTLIHGWELREYLRRSADYVPYNETTWFLKILAFPDEVGDFRMQNYLDHMAHPNATHRLAIFYGPDQDDRRTILYDESMRSAKTIHINNDPSNRILQHFYAFAFFADPDMASFYKRFIRDFVRFDDRIFCHAARLVALIREESLRLNPENNGDYYALHIRRGDIHVKAVKVSAKQIMETLRFPDNSSIIPRDAYVYIATDDPDGVCSGCVEIPGKLCPKINVSNPRAAVPWGCLNAADSSWAAFIEAGWHIRFLRDFSDKGLLKGVNQHMHAFIETVICSRAKRFSGSLYSTYTGYIHRLRGYYGLGEESYLHAPIGRAMQLRDPRSVGSGYMREWRAGWTDDNGELI